MRDFSLGEALLDGLGAEGLRRRGRPRIGDTVSLALRIFTLALLLGWQAVAVGASGSAHVCQRQIERHSDHCKCPHGELKAAHAPDASPVLRSDCCDEPGWELPAPTFADLSGHSALFALQPALLPTWLSVRPPQTGAVHSFTVRDRPLAQGPPVFLRIRTLLL
jgi:hypothetical protein